MYDDMDMVLSSDGLSGTTLPCAVVRANWFEYGCCRNACAGEPLKVFGGGAWYTGRGKEAIDCDL